MNFYKVALLGPEDWDDFGFVHNALVWRAESEGWPEPWGILSYDLDVLDAMGEWFALERNRSFDYAKKNELPDHFVLFRKEGDLKSQEWEIRIQRTGRTYSIIDCP